MSPSRPPKPRVAPPSRPRAVPAARPDGETDASRPAAPGRPGGAPPSATGASAAAGAERVRRTASTPRDTSATRAASPAQGASRAAGAPRAARTAQATGGPDTAAPAADGTGTFGRAVTTYTAGGRGLTGRGGPVAPPVVSSSSAARFEERARARRSRSRRKVATVAGGAAAAGALGWLLLLSPVLALDPQDVRVEGAGTVVAVDQVLDVVDAHAGTPLPRLDTVRLRDEVLEVPGVREARVTRGWPHGLLVVLVAREPVAAVPEPAEGGLALLDMEGVQVGRVDAAPDGLPVVDVPVGDARTLSAVLAVLEQLPADLLAQVQGVSARTQDTVTMQLRDGVRVDWGSASETPLKIAVLSTLRSSGAAAGATVIDVSAPRLPITR